MQEFWTDVNEFPNYSVSDEGHVRNDKTGTVLSTRINHQDIVMVNLVRNGQQYTRSVALLVAYHHIEAGPVNFNSPIHLDGDHSNCRASNLLWRPRWFAVLYHAQFKKEPFKFTDPIYLADTDEIFENPRDAAMKYGLLERDIVKDIHNHEGVWPYGYDFRIFKE